MDYPIKTAIHYGSSMHEAPSTKKFTMLEDNNIMFLSNEERLMYWGCTEDVPVSDSIRID